MGASVRMEIPHALTGIAGRRIEARPLGWPLAVAVIAGLSLGLWVLLFRLTRLALHLL